MRTLGALLLVWLAPALCRATPPHALVEVKPGETTFVRLYQVRALGVQDPTIATAELLPSEELLISGHKAGTTDVVALSGGRIVGLRVHVRAPGTRLDDLGPARLDAAKKSCPVLRLVGEGPEQQLGVTPAPAACRVALAALFQTDRFLTKQISVDFNPETLQAQLAELEPALRAAGLTLPLHYQGATRMGAADDGTSVCGPNSQVWGVDALYVAGNNVIPTPIACNPTLTSAVS